MTKLQETYLLQTPLILRQLWTNIQPGTNLLDTPCIRNLDNCRMLGRPHRYLHSAEKNQAFWILKSTIQCSSTRWGAIARGSKLMLFRQFFLLKDEAWARVISALRHSYEQIIKISWIVKWWKLTLVPYSIWSQLCRRQSYKIKVDAFPHRVSASHFCREKFVQTRHTLWLFSFNYSSILTCCNQCVVMVFLSFKAIFFGLHLLKCVALRTALEVKVLRHFRARPASSHTGLVVQSVDAGLRLPLVIVFELSMSAKQPLRLTPFDHYSVVSDYHSGSLRLSFTGLGME